MNADAQNLTLNNRRLMIRLFIVAVGMFGFGFALVPFYKTICEIAGLNDLLRPDEVHNTQVDLARSVTIEFDANTRELPWLFRPLTNTLSVHPGQLVRIDYEVENTLDRPVTGQAIPSYGPIAAAQSFKKLDCFCFTKQTLQAREKRVMPVVFSIDRNLSTEISIITLSYTFFEVAGTAVNGATMHDAEKIFQSASKSETRNEGRAG